MPENENGPINPDAFADLLLLLQQWHGRYHQPLVVVMAGPPLTVQHVGCSLADGSRWLAEAAALGTGLAARRAAALPPDPSSHPAAWA
jgi:hypothetical protein